MFRAGRSLAPQLISNPGEQLIDFLSRALADGWPIEPESIVVTDNDKMILVTPEAAKERALTGKSVKDVLHIRLDSNKPIDLKDVIRKASKVEKGELDDDVSFSAKAFGEAQKTFEVGKREQETEELKKRRKVEAAARAKSQEGRPGMRPDSRTVSKSEFDTMSTDDDDDSRRRRKPDERRKPFFKDRRERKDDERNEERHDEPRDDARNRDKPPFKKVESKEEDERR